MAEDAATVLLSYHFGRLRGLVSGSLRGEKTEKAWRCACCLVIPDVCVSGAAVRLVVCRAAAVSGVLKDCIIAVEYGEVSYKEKAT